MSITITLTIPPVICGLFYSYIIGTTKYKMIDIKKMYKNNSNILTIVDENYNYYQINNLLNYIEEKELSQIEIDKKIIIHYYGWRISLLGIFPNIISINQNKILNLISKKELDLIEKEYLLNKIMNNIVPYCNNYE